MQRNASRKHLLSGAAARYHRPFSGVKSGLIRDGPSCGDPTLNEERRPGSDDYRETGRQPSEPQADAESEGARRLKLDRRAEARRQIVIDAAHRFLREGIE